MRPHKVVVIGAGIAGLTAGIYLARAGSEVTIYEQHTLPGGYVSSFNREGYVFPAGLTSFCSNGILFPILRELGLYERVTFQRIQRQWSWGQVDLPLESPGQVAQGLGEHFPMDARALRSYFRLMQEGIAWNHLFESSGAYLESSRLRLFSAFLGAPFRAPRVLWLQAAHSGETNRDLHRRMFRSAELIAMLDQLGYPVMPAFNTVGMWASFLSDYWIPLHSMQAFTNSLAREFRERGGKLVLGSRVRWIQVEGGRAVGVELEGGEAIPADAVLAAGDIHAICQDLLDREYVPADLQAKLERGGAAESMFSVFLGLDPARLPAGALDRFREGHVLYFSRSGELIQLVLWSKDDPSLAPAGKHSLVIGKISPYPRWAAWKGERDARYQTAKQAETEHILDLAEEFIPGLRQAIEVSDAATPLTYERYTGNWQGASVGWSWDPAKAPGMDFARDGAFLPGLFLAGHWTFRLGGLPAAAITARFAALRLLETLQTGK